jgi:hypothetical protein
MRGGMHMDGKVVGARWALQGNLAGALQRPTCAVHRDEEGGGDSDDDEEGQGGEDEAEQQRVAAAQQQQVQEREREQARQLAQAQQQLAETQARAQAQLQQQQELLAQAQAQVNLAHHETEVARLQPAQGGGGADGGAGNAGGGRAKNPYQSFSLGDGGQAQQAAGAARAEPRALWARRMDAEGRCFYQNERTRQVVWALPTVEFFQVRARPPARDSRLPETPKTETAVEFSQAKPRLPGPPFPPRLLQFGSTCLPPTFLPSYLPAYLPFPTFQPTVGGCSQVL